MAKTTAVTFTFGRFQPPTRGHEHLFRRIQKLTAMDQGDVFVFLSQTVDKKNPLPAALRGQLITRGVPGIRIGPATVRTPIHAFTWLRDQGYTMITAVVGSDRTSDFTRMVDSWHLHEDPDRQVTIQLTSIPRTGKFDEAILSGSVARSLARRGQLSKFQQMLIGGQSEMVAKRVMQLIQKTIGPLTETHMTLLPFRLWTLREADEPIPDPAVTKETPVKVNTGEFAVGDTTDDERVSSDTPDNQSMLVIRPKAKLRDTLSAKARMLRQMNAK